MMQTGDFLTSRVKVQWAHHMHAVSIVRVYLLALQRTFHTSQLLLTQLTLLPLLNRTSYLIESLLFLKFVDEVTCFCCQ